jgi:hypothetical protein
LALPPDPTSSFVREVDEELRKEQMEQTAKKYGGLFAVVAVVVLLLAGGYLLWKDRQAKRAGVATEELKKAFDLAGEGKPKAATEALSKLHDEGDAVRASARLAEAAMALEQNDKKAAIAQYAAVAGDKDLPDAYRDLALIRQTVVEYDSLKPDEVIRRMQPLAESGKPYFGTAGELTGMALIAKGQNKQAGELFAKVAADKQLPDSLRSRAVQIAGSLGVDASASLPSAAIQ